MEDTFGEPWYTLAGGTVGLGLVDAVEQASVRLARVCLSGRVCFGGLLNFKNELGGERHVT
jgi:hypothetical protein